MAAAPPNNPPLYPCPAGLSQDQETSITGDEGPEVEEEEEELTLASDPAAGR